MTAPHNITPERVAALHAIRDRHRGDACATQAARLLDALESLQHITTYEASRCLDLYDPRARKLKHLLGIPVKPMTQSVTTSSRRQMSPGMQCTRRWQVRQRSRCCCVVRLGAWPSKTCFSIGTSG